MLPPKNRGEGEAGRPPLAGFAGFGKRPAGEWFKWFNMQGRTVCAPMSFGMVRCWRRMAFVSTGAAGGLSLQLL